jgi:tetratricopeptide (TPR) repeat protein
LRDLDDLGNEFNTLEKLLKPPTLNNKALALKHLNRNEEALERLNQAITANPNDIDMLINKGSVLHNMKQYKEAIEVYDMAISINPNQSFSNNPNKAKVYYNKGIALKMLNQNE